MLTELRKKQTQRLALSLKDTKPNEKSAPLLSQDMVYYNSLNAHLGDLRMSIQKLNPKVWYKNPAPETVLDKETRIVRDTEFTMLRCPKGSFNMTGYCDEKINFKFDKPIKQQPKKTEIEMPFFLGETEVTEKLYFAVAGNVAERRAYTDASKPMLCSSYYSPNPWYSAIQFCNILSDLHDLDRCYTPSKNIILFRDFHPKESTGKAATVFYEKLIECLKGLGIENVYLDTEVKDDVLIKNPFYLIHGGVGYANNRFASAKNRLNLRPAFNISNYINVPALKYRFSKEVESGVKAFVEYLHKHPICDTTKNGYRLPMAKEWEYAAKAGTENAWAGTNSLDLLNEYAWYGQSFPFDRSKDLVHPIKQKKPNEWGFYDMSGNVAELCNDIANYNVEGDYNLFLKQYFFIDYVYRGGDVKNRDPRIDSFPALSNDGFPYLGFRIAQTIIE